MTQTITLQPGWNAVWLEVQPEPRDCDSVFAGLPVESVWAWNRRLSTIQFLQDPAQLLPGQPDWLTYFPLASGDPSFTTLFAIHGGRSYLIKSTATQPITWTIRGRPVLTRPDWIKDSLNFVGFPLDPASPTTFGRFFSSSAAHAGQPIFRLQPSGLWEKVLSPETTPMRAGEAFWIYAASVSTYAGPTVVRTENYAGIDFDRILPETIVKLRNESSVTRVWILTPQEAAVASPGVTPALAGPVPLAYWRMDLASQVYGWYPLDAPAEVVLKAGQEIELRLAIRRADLRPYTPVAGISDYQYQSLLEVSDLAGSRVRIPITARGGRANVAQPGLAGTDPIQPHPHAGLWVGSAVIRAVSQPANSSDPNLPRPTGSEAQFRLIVHVNATGQARLLQQVTLLWTNGVTDSLGNLLQAGRHVLITDQALLGRFSGATFKEGKAVGRRLSTVGFSHAQPISMVGPFGDIQSPLECGVTIDYEDPQNPFKHRFHPDHDNLDEEYATVRPEGAESFTVRRGLKLVFTESDPDGRVTSRWGGDQVGGKYSETITGLHKAPLSIQGTFRLNRVSLIPLLDLEQ